MELNLNTKFEIGNRVFVIIKENRCWQKKETCDVCMGQGYVPYREYRCTCPKCNGRGEIVIEEKRVELSHYRKCDTPISRMDIIMSKDGDMRIKYRVDGRNYSEENLCSTEDEARVICEARNRRATGEEE